MFITWRSIVVILSNTLFYQVDIVSVTSNWHTDFALIVESSVLPLVNHQKYIPYIANHFHGCIIIKLLFPPIIVVKFIYSRNIQVPQWHSASVVLKQFFSKSAMNPFSKMRAILDIRQYYLYWSVSFVLVRVILRLIKDRDNEIL